MALFATQHLVFSMASVDRRRTGHGKVVFEYDKLDLEIGGRSNVQAYHTGLILNETLAMSNYTSVASHRYASLPDEPVSTSIA